MCVSDGRLCVGAALDTLLYGEAFDQGGGDFYFYGVGDGAFYFSDELCGGCLAHEFSGDVDGGDGGVYDAAFGDVVETCDGDVFGDFVAAEFEGFDGADGDEVVVCEVGACEGGAAVYDLQHVGECAFNRRGEFVDDGFGGGHAVFADCPLKAVAAFAEVCDLVGGGEVSWLAAAAVNEVAGSEISALGVIAEYAAAVCGIEIGIQEDYWDGQLEKFMAYGSGDFGSQKDDACTLGDAEFFDVFLKFVGFFVELEGFQVIAVFAAFLFDSFGELGEDWGII